MAVAQFGFESSLQPPLAPTTPGLTSDVVSAASDAVPPGACVLTDQASYTIAANRFVSSRPGLRAHGGRRRQRLLAVPGPERGRPAPGACPRSARCGCRRCGAPSTCGCRRCPTSASPGPPRQISVYFDQHFVPRRRTARLACTCARASPPLIPRTAAVRPRRSAAVRRSERSARPQDQPGPRLGRERGGLAGQPFPAAPRPRTRPRRAAGCR